MLKIAEILSGILLLSGRFVPLALLILAPIVLQIVMFHVFLYSGGMALPIVILILELYLGLVVYRSSFDSVLSACGGPSGGDG